MLDAQKAFVSLSLFNILRQPVNSLPDVIATIIQVFFSPPARDFAFCIRLGVRCFVLGASFNREVDQISEEWRTGHGQCCRAAFGQAIWAHSECPSHGRIFLLGLDGLLHFEEYQFPSSRRESGGRRGSSWSGKVVFMRGHHWTDGEDSRDCAKKGTNTLQKNVHCVRLHTVYNCVL